MAKMPAIEHKEGKFMQAVSRSKRSSNVIGLSYSVLLAAAAIALSGAPAEAIVYCSTVGIPRGCVVRPMASVVRAVTPGVGAPGVGVRRGTPMNRGGPVNRVGVR